jgi:hypothetical protein
MAENSKKPLLFKRSYYDRNRVKIIVKHSPVSALLRSLLVIILTLLYGEWIFLRYGGPLLPDSRQSSAGTICVSGAGGAVARSQFQG